MKKQGIIELVIGIVGTAILLVFQNKWSYIPLVIIGILGVVTIRKSILKLTDNERRCSKKRNVLSAIFLPVFAVICYFSANEIIRNDLLWILLSVYLFLTAHGILFIAPINTFGNERK